MMPEKAKPDGRTTLKEIFGVFRESTLSLGEKALWILYRSYDSGDGAHPGDEVLAMHMGKSIRSIQNYRTRLIERGFLTKEFRGRNVSIFRATIPAQAPQPTAPPPHTPPYMKSTGSTGST